MRLAARTLLVLVGLWASSLPALAQQPKRVRQSSTSSGSIGVRAELAAVLLQSGRYEEAAREYRVLLTREPSSFDYRLGLAHALAWGNHPREAERELVQLIAKRPGTPGLDSLLRTVRDAFDPRAIDAAQWVASDPLYSPYRLALARALAREKMYQLAIVHFDTLLMRVPVGRIPDRSTLLREIADAYIAAGDRAGAAERIRAALALAPADTALRHTLAMMLVDSRHFADAEAQYDTLIAQLPSAPLLIERAQLRLSLGNRAGAESDLWSAVGLQPSASAYLLLGDLYRERGDYRGARSMYTAARQGASAEIRTALAAGLAQLDREERPAMLAPIVGDDPGWRVSENAAADNLGLTYSALALTRTVAVTSSTRLSLGGEWRQLALRTAPRRVDASGFGATAGGWQEAAYGPVLGRIEIDGGALYHPIGGTFGTAHAALAGWLYAWQANLELATEPAYPSLFSIDALLPGDGGRALTERDAGITLGGPIGPLDVAVSAQRSLLSDGNRRLTSEAYLRYPLGADLYAVYAGSGIGFAQRSALYWDPQRYFSQSAGIEYAVRRARGFSVAARVLPSYAMSDEAPVLPPIARGTTPGFERGPVARRTAVQLGAGAEAGYRVHGWEAAAALSYGRGRAGAYQRVGASITVRMAP